MFDMASDTAMGGRAAVTTEKDQKMMLQARTRSIKNQAVRKAPPSRSDGEAPKRGFRNERKANSETDTS
jgi:hypothetical protein